VHVGATEEGDEMTWWWRWIDGKGRKEGRKGVCFLCLDSVLATSNTLLSR